MSGVKQIKSVDTPVLFLRIKFRVSSMLMTRVKSDEVMTNPVVGFL